MTRLSWFLCLCFCLLGAFSSLASAQLAWDPKEFMGVDEIHAGMRGYGKTVYQGTKIETFDIEVIGVLRRIDFGFDMILIKVTSGPLVERKLQTVAGMSGSPIYIDDRLIGAYAYGWDFQQEPIAGVTPIAAMLNCTQPGSVAPSLVGALTPQGKVLTVNGKLITRVKVAATRDDAEKLQAKAEAATMVLSPCAAPVLVSGMPDAALKPLRQLFEKYNLRAEAGAGETDGPAPPLEAGSAVGVSLMEGDANMTAVGTVTYVKGDTVLAFGHPFFGWGNINMPMSVAYVHGVINSAQSSFKLASPIARVGAATSDRQFALGGVLGKTPDTMPVSLYVSDPLRNLKRAYSVAMIQHPAMTPYMLYLWVLFNGASQLGDFAADEGTFTTRALLTTDKLGTIEQNLVVAPQINGDMLPMADFYFLTELLSSNPYEPVKLKKVSVEVSYAPEKNFAIIEKITSDRLVAHPGDTVNLAVKIRPYGKPVETQTVTVKVPEFTAEPAMLVLVAGGAHSMLVKSLLEPFPAPEEGVKGIVRWFTQNVTAKNMLTAQLFPSPSYAYRGRMLNDLPLPILDLLQFNDATGMMPATGGGKAERDAPADEEEGVNTNSNTRPSFVLRSQPVPYVLVGGEAAMIKIQTEEASMLARGDDFNFTFQVPVLSAALTPDRESGGGGGRADMEASVRAMPWYSPQQRARIAMLSAALQPAQTLGIQPLLPTFHMPAFGQPTSLSFSQVPSTRAEQTINAKPGKGDKDEVKKPGQDDDANGDDEDEDDGEQAGPPSGPPSKDNVLLSARRYSWGLTGRNDFLRGKHVGTGVTSKGTLMLIPAVRALFQTTSMAPSRLVATAQGIYVTGWNTNQLLRLGADGAPTTIFPKADGADDTQVITALAADAAGNLLIGLYPDQTALLLSPDGAVQKTWRLPGTMVWSLAVTTGGKRYVGTDAGGLYLLKDDETVQVVTAIADKHVLTLTAGLKDDLYAGTYPRGKVFHVKADGYAESIYEARGAVASLAVDRKGNVYVGTSPTCRVVRVSTDGTSLQIMRGMGRGNRHITALQMVGDDLYAATGPAGGIYRIIQPASQDAEVTPIFARADTRDGANDGNGGTGPESLMVNALTLTPQGTLLAAASTPGQVLALEPRTQGTFLSSVLQTPAVAQWGQLETHIRSLKGQTVGIESRSGNTAIPDGTWGNWKPLSPDGAELTSAPATFAQFRVRMTGTPTSSPVLEYARLYYQPNNQAPKVILAVPKTGTFWRGTKDIRWDARDPDEDKMIYTIFISKDDGQTWNQLSRPAEDKPEVQPAAEPKKGKKADAKATTPKPAEQPKMQSEVAEKSISWDSKSVPDGTYRVKIIASDKYARPVDAKSSEIISGRFTVDNTMPAVALDEKVFGWEKLKRFDITDNLTPIVGGRYKIDDGEWTALVAEDGIFNSKREAVLLVSPNGTIDLPAGAHKVLIQVKDSAENQTDKTISLVIGEKAPQPTARLAIPPIGEANQKDLAELMLYNLQ